MKTGTRKTTMFLITFLTTALFAFSALLSGVKFQGNDVVIIIVVLVSCGGWFAGMNVGEWFASALKTKYESKQQ